VRTSNVYVGMICFVIMLVFMLGDASELTATSLECQHDDTSHSDKDVGLLLV